jgi:predicted ATPase
VGANDLIAELDGRRVLLVLDNLEQVLGCAEALADIVSRTGEVSLLVTSREPLDVAAERRYLVPLLDTAAAVELFHDRADALGVSLGADEGVLEAICDQLEGLPLAVELAAARTSAFSPEELLQRLTSSAGLLGSSRRDSPERHRTLGATIEWSHSLLDESERDVFAQLGIFAGGWTRAAGEAVTDSPSHVVESLVAKSLVRHDGRRFSMLESIRHDARKRLDARGDAERLARAHATYIAQLVRRLDAERSDGWLLALDLEHPNLRAAFDWALAEGEADLALELATSARTFWEARGHVEEGSRRLHAALALPGVSDAVRARGLYAAGILRARALRYQDAEQLHGEAVTLNRRLGDEQGLARALNSYGIALYHQQRLVEAEAALTESLDLKRRLGDERGAAIALLSLGNTAIAAGDLELAEHRQREALVSLRAAGDELGVATALDDLAGLRLLADDFAGAQVLLEESLGLSRRLGALSNVACALGHLGLALASSDRERSLSVLSEALVLFQSLSEEDGIAATLEALASWWLPLDAERAATLLGAAEAIRVREGARPLEVERRARERVEEAGAEALSRVNWESAVARGRTANVADVVARALASPLPHPVTVRP